ncbi:MAG: sce7726 family protein [Mesorhizobium sp.]|uniref:sce7726 family protein n=1 Tax=Mesorhizobium sp. TaxID=1871066 RepID=UPI001AC68FC0|nr:sce7726 family protein [Mesorhizobium sp.]MBN9220940.1 sce7726 family protein [Mesorhizobium sp.]
MRDSDVRAAVKAHLDTLHGGSDDTRIVEEMGVWSGTVRVDIAVINGEICGYELKSDSDNLNRLSYQVEMYGKVFDRMTLVVGAKHHKKALALIPKWWGYVVAEMRSSEVTLKSKRQARRNPNPDPFVVAQLLWKDEAIAILERHNLAKGWRRKPAAEISQRLISVLTFEQLSVEVRFALKARERLGQLIPGKFDVSIDAETNPACGASRGSWWS